MKSNVNSKLIGGLLVAVLATAISLGTPHAFAGPEEDKASSDAAAEADKAAEKADSAWADYEKQKADAKDNGDSDKDAEKAAILTVPKGMVEFRNVQFSYLVGSNLVLQDFNLKTKPGERVGIVGPSGGGKSTILKLLVRLHDLNSGAILVDHQDIAGVTQSSLHQHIACVPQDPILFHRSLMENIRFSRPGATDEEVIRAAKLAHCHEFISSFPAGYQTLVGERGVKLSGGERQRVAIARAILMNAPILVLDEATSSLDSESETYIQDSLSKLVIGRTVIAVAHRLSTTRKMDRIVVVKDGHIIEEGSHDLLVKIENGVYQRLWNLQSTDLLPGNTKGGRYIQ